MSLDNDFKQNKRELWLLLGTYSHACFFFEWIEPISNSLYFFHSSSLLTKKLLLKEVGAIHSMEAGAVVKGEDKSNDLMKRIVADSLFKALHETNCGWFTVQGSTWSELWLVHCSRFVCRAPKQVDGFLAEEVKPVLVADKSWCKSLYL